jgi:hypothetical protein
LLRLCLDVILHVCSLSPSRREAFLRSASLGQGVILDRRVFFILQIVLFSILRSNSIIEFKTLVVKKFNFQSISYV